MKRLLLCLVVGTAIADDCCYPQWVLQNKLIRAIRKQYIPYIDEALCKGADLNLQTRRCKLPLGAAAANGSVQIVKYLLGRGAQVNAQDGLGRTALMRAAEQGQVTVVRYLLQDAGAITVLFDHKGRTAADIARYHGYPYIARLIDDYTYHVK